MRNYQTIILSNHETNPGYWRMRILAPGFAAAAQPGQFVMFRPEQALPTMLRRPFGIFRTGCLAPECSGLPPREYLEILYKVVGQGTRIMSELHAGDRVELLGPLGRGFSVSASACAQLLVGGGIGLVPLFLLAEALIAKGHQVRLLMGGRTRDDILAVTEFERLGVETYVSTDDGSLGEEGLVTRVLERKLDQVSLCRGVCLRTDADAVGGRADLPRAPGAAAGVAGGAHGLRRRRLPGVRGQGRRAQRPATELPLHLQGGAGFRRPPARLGAGRRRERLSGRGVPLMNPAKRLNLAVEVAGIRLRNPVMPASGTFGYGEEFAPYLDLERLGAIVTKGLSLRPKAGNPMPRIAETTSGMLNAIGLQNVGVDAFIAEKTPRLPGARHAGDRQLLRQHPRRVRRGRAASGRRPRGRGRGVEHLLPERQAGGDRLRHRPAARPPRSSPWCAGNLPSR